MSDWYRLRAGSKWTAGRLGGGGKWSATPEKDGATDAQGAVGGGKWAVNNEIYTAYKGWKVGGDQHR